MYQSEAHKSLRKAEARKNLREAEARRTVCDGVTV